MSRKEVPRAGLVQAALAGRISNREGARGLHMSIRQFQRLKGRRSVLVEREVGPRLTVIAEIAGHDAVEVALAEDEHVIQALAPDRADEPLRERFRHGLCGAVTTSSMPILFTRCRNC
jgi:hypothetical protein